MSNLDITFDNAYEYHTNDDRGSHHYIKNNDVGLLIDPGKIPVFFEGHNIDSRNYFYPLSCTLENIGKSSGSITTHFQCNNMQLGLIKHDTQYDNACNRSNVCLNEMKSLHFRFK